MGDEVNAARSLINITFHSLTIMNNHMPRTDTSNCECLFPMLPKLESFFSEVEKIAQTDLQHQRY